MYKWFKISLKLTRLCAVSKCGASVCEKYNCC